MVPIISCAHVCGRSLDAPPRYAMGSASKNVLYSLLWETLVWERQDIRWRFRLATFAKTGIQSSSRANAFVLYIGIKQSCLDSMTDCFVDSIHMQWTRNLRSRIHRANYSCWQYWVFHSLHRIDPTNHNQAMWHHCTSQFDPGYLEYHYRTGKIAPAVFKIIVGDDFPLISVLRESAVEVVVAVELVEVVPVPLIKIGFMFDLWRWSNSDEIICVLGSSKKFIRFRVAMRCVCPMVGQRGWKPCCWSFRVLQRRNGNQERIAQAMYTLCALRKRDSTHISQISRGNSCNTLPINYRNLSY